jgi:hypothetical protein
MKMGGKLLDQERHEQMKIEEQKRENEQREKQATHRIESSPFEGFRDPLRQSDPDLFDIIHKAIRFFTK